MKNNTIHKIIYTVYPIRNDIFPFDYIDVLYIYIVNINKIIYCQIIYIYIMHMQQIHIIHIA